MKICFLMGRRFAYIAHYLAIWLKEKHGVKDFCGYVSLRSSYEFLKTQKEIQYTSLILDEDVHKKYEQETLDIPFLNRLEKEYGLPNLWPYLASDRILMFSQLIREYPYNTPLYSHEEMLKILLVKAKKIISFLEEEKPSFLIINQALGGGSLLLYHIAKKMGIRVIIMLFSYIPNTITLSETYDDLTWSNEIFKNNLCKPGFNNSNFYKAAADSINNFRAKPRVYSKIHNPAKQTTLRRQQMKFLLPQNFLNSLIWFLKLIYYHFSSTASKDYSYIHPWNYLKDHLARKFNNFIGADDLYDEFNPKENFAFFPLHYEPEVSLLLLAPFMTDQVNLIRQVAKSLPVDYKLYVKEHPQMAAYRRRSYYKEIKKIPNVKLLHPKISSFEILKNTKLITVISGAAGWEGTLFKKPVITFGNVFYNHLSFVKNCQNLSQLPWIVNDQLNHFSYNEHELITFIAAILQESTYLDLLYLWEQETDEEKKKEGLRPLADLIAKKLDLA